MTRSSHPSKHEILACLEFTETDLIAVDQRITELEETAQINDRRLRGLSDSIRDINHMLHSLEEKLNKLDQEDSLFIPEKLHILDEIDLQNTACANKLALLQNELHEPHVEIKNDAIEADVQVTLEFSRKLDHAVIMERNRLLQLNSLAEEYEQTLLDFKEITEAAEEFIRNEIVTNSLEELQEEMQRYRKFFVNLNHCKMILESLETNLDPMTREKYAELHSTLYNKTTAILERAVERAAKLAHAASKWTLFEKDMRNEKQWLHVAQQRVPDLQNVSSEDFEQYITLYESLHHDILNHHTKMAQQCEIAKKMQELITAPILEKDSNEALAIMVHLREEVSLYHNMLEKFRVHWNQYNSCADKLGDWISSCQKTLNAVTIPQNLIDTPVEDMRKFWEIKAQYEVLNNKIYGNACDSFDHALSTITISDEQLQRQLHGQLLENWFSISSTISHIQTQIYDSIKTDATPACDKIAFIEKELQDITSIFNGTKGVLKNQEDLYMYIEKLQTLQSRIYLIDSELGQIALALDCDTDKVSAIFESSKIVSQQINEEHEAAEVFYKRLEEIENGIREQERRFLRISKILDECCTSTNGKKPDVERALDDARLCQSDLGEAWNELMKLRQLLHTLPMNLKVSVSPVQTERDLSVLQNIHSDLEHKCENNMTALKNRLALWNKFHRQLDIIQEHVQETEFMMELLQVQESADYNRLLKATERLDALLQEIERRNSTIEDLQSIAQPLIESSDENVSQEIQDTVEKVAIVWENTRDNLRDLCQRYEKAVNLWRNYHDVCDTMKNWVNQDFVDFDSLKHIEDLPQLEVYQHALFDKKQDLDKLKNIINDINQQVGFNIGSSLLSDIEEFSKRLESLEESLASQMVVADVKTVQKTENFHLLQNTSELIDQLRSDIQEPKADAALYGKIANLRSYMISLSATESRLKDIVYDRRDSGNESDGNENFKKLHTLSQSLMQDTFHQYQEMLDQMMLHGSDADILQIWQDYQTYVKTFLAQDIPCDDTKLQQVRDQCILIDYLLRNLRTALMKKSKIEANLLPRYNALNEQHSECSNAIDDRLLEINNRLRQWESFRSNELNLKDLVTDIEREKYTLQLEYINIKELPQLITKVNKLQERIPQLESYLQSLSYDMTQLILYTKDEYTIIHLTNVHGRMEQRISKLKENVQTWRIFLSGIEELYAGFDFQCSQIQRNLNELHICLEALKQDSLGASQHHLNMLKNEQLRLVSVRDELININIAKDELKRCISMFDAKLIHKRVWKLWQFYEKLEYSLSILLKQMQERLQNRKQFSNQYLVLMAWMADFEKRINDSNKYQTCEDDASFIKSVEEMLLQEMTLKECEVDWLNVIGKDLVANLEDGEERLEIESSLDELNMAWKKLLKLCQERSQKISEIHITIISLQRRINEIKAWMMEVEHELKKPFFFENTEKTSLDRLLDEYEKLQRSIEGTSGNVAEVLNLCEMLFTDVESWNVHIDRRHIHQDIRELEQRWKNICLDSSKRKQDLLSIWNMLLELQNITDSHQSWVHHSNQYLNELENRTGQINTEDIGEYLEELEIKTIDASAQEPILYILRRLFVSLNKHERVDRVNIRQIMTQAKQMLLTWETLSTRFILVKTRYHEILTLYTTFKSEYENIIMALTQIDVQVTNIKHLPGPNEDTPEIKLKQLRDLHNELRFVINLFDKQDERGSSLMQMLSPSNAAYELVQNNIQEYHNLANNIKDALDAILTETIEESEKQKTQQVIKVEAAKDERDSAVQVNTLPILAVHSKSITAKEAYRYQLEAALSEARNHLDGLEGAINEINVNNFMTSTQKVSKASAACESSIELIKHLNIMLLSESDGSDEDTLSKQVKEQCERFVIYLTEWRTKQQKLEELSNDDYLTCPLCTNRNWQQIDNDLWRLEQWLLMAEATQKTQHTNPPTDIDTLEDTIQDHREFLLDLDSHKSIIKSLNIVGEHLATHTLDTEKAVKLRERLQADNQRWEKVCTQASHWQSQLHRSLMENKEFHRTVTELCVWLEQTENKIKSSEPIDLTSDQKLIERKYKTFKELRSDLVRCEPRVVSLQETTSQLTKYLDSHKSQHFDEIYAKLTDLRLRFHSIRRLVEMYIIKIGAALGYDPSMDDNSAISMDSRQEIRDGSGSHLAAQESNANAQDEEDEDHINTTILTRSYRFLGRVLRASLPIQAMLLLLLGVVTLMPHGEDYSCSLTNNFARSLEPMLRYPNGPPPI